MAAHAIVTLTIKVESNSSWSDDTTIAQVKRQAIAGVKGELNRLIRQDAKLKMQITGEPSVEVVAFVAR